MAAKNDTELIIALMKEQDKKRDIQIKVLHRNMEAGLDAFNVKLDAIKEGNRAMSNIVQGNHDNIREIKKDTAVWRWAHRNPKLSFIIIGVFFSGIAGILGHINRETVENIIKKLIGL